jgi:hypothetical protein
MTWSVAIRLILLSYYFVDRRDLVIHLLRWENHKSVEYLEN